MAYVQGSGLKAFAPFSMDSGYQHPVTRARNSGGFLVVKKLMDAMGNNIIGKTICRDQSVSYLDQQEKRVITFGTFDVLHVGHIRILQRAKALGTRLIVGVSTDDLNFKKKLRYPVYSEQERVEIIRQIRFVDEVFLEESLERKAEYIKQYKADILVMGNDWEGRFDLYKAYCDVVYLPRTEGISTSDILSHIKKLA